MIPTTPCKFTRLPHQEKLTAASTARNQEHSPLLRLPAELRNKIYHYVIVVERIRIWPSQMTMIRSREYRVCSFYVRKPTIHLTALSATCRKLHADTALLPFRWNTFSGEGVLYGESWVKFLRTTSLEQRAAISRWSVHESTLEDAEFLRFLSDCRGLESLIIHSSSCEDPYLSMERRAALERLVHDKVGIHVEILDARLENI